MEEIEQMFMQSATFSPSVNYFTMHVGQKILQRSHIIECFQEEEIRDKYMKILQNYLQWFIDPGMDISITGQGTPMIFI